MRNKLLSGIVAAGILAAAGASQEMRNEPYRPQIHFSPQQHWMNDPNGLVYFQGEYHLFFQYNPTAMVPGHIGWGHAVSRDLLHWQELPQALAEANGEMVFTGSVVVDQVNSSGLCAGGKPCLVAIYTGHRGDGASARETQNIAASQDRGRTWTRYSGDPVLDLQMANFRDPGVSWNDVTKSWVMAVARPDEHQVSLYASPDLKRWTHLSDFGATGATGGQWECPNLVKVPSGDGTPAVWAMKVGINPGGLQGGSGEQYFFGSFDGKAFTQSSESGSHGWTDYGKDSYCAVSYNNLPAGSKPTLIGWMNNWQYADKVPTSPWRGQMTMPRRLTYSKDADGAMLVEQPVVEPLRMGRAVTFQDKLNGKSRGPLTSSPAEVMATFSPGDAETFGLKLYSDGAHWTEIGYTAQPSRLYVDRTHSGQQVARDFPAHTEAPAVAGRGYDLHLIVDRNSVEVFGQGGSIAMTNLVFPPSQALRIVPFRKGGSGAASVHGRVWKLRSVWNPAGAGH